MNTDKHGYFDHPFSFVQGVAQYKFFSSIREICVYPCPIKGQ
jgi:hypothetical protein